MKPFGLEKVIKGIAKDKKGNILPDIEVTLYGSDGKKIDTVITGPGGIYSFVVDTDKDFKLIGSKEQYFDGRNEASTKTEEEVIIADVILEKDPGLYLYCLVTDKASKAPIEGVSIKMTNNLTGEEEQVITPETGDFRKALANNKLDDRISYNMDIKAKGYLGKIVTYNKLLNKEGRYDVHNELDLSLNKVVEGETKLEDLIDIKPIYFDLGRSSIRKDAAIELDKIVKVMNENPSMVVELGSHTDARGSAKSNESLSSRRAKSSASYIRKKITNPERINGKGYGEVQLVNRCTDGVKCSEEEHQANRRTEFRIIKM